MFVVRIHLQQNTGLELTFGEAFHYHHTGMDVEMKVDGVGSNAAQVVSEGRYEAVVESLEHPNVRNLEVSAGCKEVYFGDHLPEEEIVDVFQNHLETLWLELDLVLVGEVEAVGRLPGQEQDQYQPQSVHFAELQTHQQGDAHGNTRLMRVARRHIVGH